MRDSVWKKTCVLPEFPQLDGSTKTDVLIIGGGMAGILTAYALEQAGVEYLLIESDQILSGVTGNTTAKITSQHGMIYDKLIREFDEETAYRYWQANEQALERYRLLSRQYPCDFEEKDAFVYSIDHPGKLEGEMSALQRLSIPARFQNQLDLPFETAGGICFSNQAQFHPLKFAAGIARGLNIREHTAARAFEGNTVLTDYGRIRAGHIIVATHFPILNKHGSYFLKLYQDRSYVLALEGACRVDGMYLDEAKGGLSLRNYGDLLLLGGGGHRTGKQGGNWALLESAAKQYYPGAKVKYRWATQDCMSLDGIPYIGRYSKRTHNLYVAAGFNKWGMTSSMAASMILSDLVQGKENPFESVFSPSRSILRSQLFSNTAEAVTNLLTISKPRCPHMGCALKWNPQERSWDCPCHGSRFDEKGNLLNNPATGDLNKPPEP